MNIKPICLILLTLGPISADCAWARGGHGGGGGHHGGGHGGGGHYGGGHHHHGVTAFYGIGGFYPGYGYGGYGLGLGYYGGYGGYGYGAYGFGAPYYPPYYAYPSVITVPMAPPVYIEQQEPAPSPAQKAANYWHYCRNPEGYYPYVQKCPDGWLQVAPQPATQ